MYENIHLKVNHMADILSQVIKSRIQSAPTGTYSGFVDCIRKTIAADGITALWKGLGPAMARVSDKPCSLVPFHL